MRSPFLTVLLSFLYLFSSQFATYVQARTTDFSPQDVGVAYSPVEAWEGAGGETIRAIQEGAKLQVRFAGEQITLFGQTSSNVQYSINLDDQSFPSSSFSPSNSASPSRVFQASNLEVEGEHTLELTVENGGTFVLNRIAVAFSSSNDNTPALLPIDPISTTALSASSSQTSLVTSPSSVANTSLNNRPYSTTPTSSPGFVVGATLGSLAAFALLIGLVYWFCRRRNSSSSDQAQKNSPYINQETGNRRSFIPSAFQRRSSSVLPWSSTPRIPLSPSPIFLNPINGGIGSSPRQQSDLSSPSTPVIVGSQTWQAKLTRAASWRRKVERLEETRKFYGVGKGGGGIGDKPELRGPPPALPLPRPPGSTTGDGPREMEERWRVKEPRLQVRRSYSLELSVSPYLIATPQDSDEGHSEEGRVQHAYGQAISTNDVSSIRVVSPTSPSPSTSMQHLRKRSNPISPSSSRFSSSAIARPFPLPTSPQSTFYQNPFTSTHSLVDSLDCRSSSLENAQITRAQTRSIGGIGGSLPNSQLDARPTTPVRSSSMRSLVDTVRAGPGEDVGLKLGEGAVMVERKPSLTRIVNGRVAVAGGEGYKKHQSVAGMIENAQDGNEAGERKEERSLTRKRREEPELPSEEDRPDYWVKRDIVPKYEVEKGDPRMRK